MEQEKPISNRTNTHRAFSGCMSSLTHPCLLTLTNLLHLISCATAVAPSTIKNATLVEWRSAEPGRLPCSC